MHAHRAVVALAALVLALPALADRWRIELVAPTLFENGEPIPPDWIIGYYVGCGISPTAVPSWSATIGPTTLYVENDFVPGVWFCFARTNGPGDISSIRSDMISFTAVEGSSGGGPDPPPTSSRPRTPTLSVVDLPN